MPIVRIAAPVFFAALALALPPPARAAVVIEGKDGDEAQRIVMEGSKLRMEGEDQQGKSVMIYDGDAKRSVQLHPEEEELRGVHARRPEEDGRDGEGRAREGGRDGAKGEGRDALREDRPHRPGAREDVRRVRGEGRGRVEGRGVCIVPFGTWRAAAGLRRAARVRRLRGRSAGGDVDRSWADLPGVPVASWRIEGGERRAAFRATKIEKVKVPASEFAVPPGWTKEPGFTEQMEALQKQVGGEKK